MNTAKKSVFYHKRPIFGLDIGSQTIKLMQLNKRPNHAEVVGYGITDTSEELIKNGVITKVPETAKLIDKLLADGIKGKLTTNRVVMGIPVSHVFTRVLTLPQMSRKELATAVELEVEQSVPLAPKDLYYDYEATSIEETSEILVRMVATPKNIVDSYVEVCNLLRLDLALIQTNVEADSQLCMLYEDIKKGTPYIIIDVGGRSVDVGILDATLRLTGTVDTGGEKFTDAIAAALHVAKPKAQQIKITKGLNAGSQQKLIQEAIHPELDKVVEEIKSIQKFYTTRIQQNVDISQIVITGGGANVPGLGDYLTNATRIPTRVSSPWSKRISFGKLKAPEHFDMPRFLTAVGLALAKESELNQ
jgi:type IV pilus assembly protein PilM